MNLCKGRYRSRVAVSGEDVAAAQSLRRRAFGGGCDLEGDPFDKTSVHVLIEEVQGGRLVCCFRLLLLESGSQIGRSYAAQFYDLAALVRFDGRMVEMGRFCVHPDLCDADVLRVAWGAMTGYVDAAGVKLLFGCTSFAGTDAATYYDTFALLKAQHLAPHPWGPRVKAPEVFRYAARLHRVPDPKRALRTMPPLLRTYLAMGGWVSDHAVVDKDMNTLHVFTGVEIAAIPPARKRLLRMAAG